MMKMIRACHLFVVCATLVVSAKCDEELLSVVTIYRHGDRTPIYSYPTDPYDASYWPIGYGQLTNTGKSQLLDLGRWLRNRWTGYLPEKYSLSDIYVRSSNVDRSLMSGLSCLAGLYPPTEEQVWDSEIKWQPIPIHTVPTSDDSLLYFFNCDAHVALTASVLQTGVFQQIWEENQELIEYVEQNSGQELTSLLDVAGLFDTLNVERMNNLELPEWTNNVYDQLYNLSSWSMAEFSWTRRQQRLIAGVVLNRIVNQFKRALAQEDIERVLMLSSHDLNIVNILNTLRKYDFVLPPYASTLVFDLRSNGTENFVDITYKRKNEVVSVVPDYCGERCTLDELVAGLQDVLLDEEQWKVECLNAPDTSDLTATAESSGDESAVRKSTNKVRATYLRRNQNSWLIKTNLTESNRAI